LSKYLLEGESVGTPRHLSFFKNIKKHLLENETLRFLLFIEKVPKHRVMESINIWFLALLSVGCFVAGPMGFIILAQFTLFGFLFYYAGLFFVLLEVLHCLFDR
jgi:hypothetical protein